MSLGRSLIAIVLTTAVIFAMAFLPFGVSQMQDQYTHMDCAYADIGTVELTMDNSSTWERIVLLSLGYDSFETSPEQASIPQEELPDYLQKGLQPYIDRGVLPFTPDYDRDINEVQCHVVYDTKTAQATGFIYWMAVLLDSETGDMLELLVDDHSGKIIFLSYTTEDYYSRTTHPPYDLLHLFLYTYLEEIADETWDFQVLEATPNGGLIHTAVVLKNPEVAETLVLSFLTDKNGLNMSVSVDNYASYDK